MMIDNILNIFFENSFSLKDKNIVLAVSGGIDSMSMLHFFAVNKDLFKIKDIYVAHFNHNLREEESFLDENVVEEYSNSLGISFIKEYGHMDKREKPKGESIESWARKLRYEFLKNVAETYDAYVLTAHNQNDSSETVLFNIIRGTGLKGARGISFINGRIIRPFLYIQRAQIEEYAKLNDVPSRYDSSNSNIQFSRNRIRNNVLPQLMEINSKAIENVYKFSSYVKEADEYFMNLANDILAKSKNENGYDIHVLVNSPKILQAYFMMCICEKAGLSKRPDERLIEEMINVLCGINKSLQLDRESFFAKQKDIVSIIKKKEPIDEFSTLINIGKNLFLNNNVVFIKRYDILKSDDLKPLDPFNLVDFDKVKGSMHLRNRREGDIFNSFKRNQSKSLKKLFNEKRIDPYTRPLIPIISDDIGIIWLHNEGVSKRVAVSEHTKTVLEIQCIEEIVYE